MQSDFWGHKISAHACLRDYDDVAGIYLYRVAEYVFFYQLDEGEDAY